MHLLRGAFLLSFFFASFAGAQLPDASSEQEELPVEVDADDLEYDARQRVLVGRGNVVVRQGDDVLTADEARVYRDTGVVEAYGNVHLERGGQVWDGPELVYNYRTGEVETSEFRAFNDPFIIRAESSERSEDKLIKLGNATITTCEGDRPEFYIRTNRSTIDEENVLRAKNVVFFLGPVPFFYFPYIIRDLDDPTNVDLVPGYSSDMGAFLLTAYNYKIHPQLRAATHLDVRTERGVGVGQDFYWYDFEKTYEGRLWTYYIDDQEPFENEADEEARGDKIDNDRYRLRLQHSQSVTERAYVLAELNYLSDPAVIEDFFDSEFRRMPIPENRVSLTQRGDWYTANLLVNKQINEDDFENVDRIPEVSLDINRTRISETPFYYEGQHEGVFLSRNLPEEREDEFAPETFRLDTLNTLYWPTRHFGFLNVIPRAGYRGTYYGTTRIAEQIQSSSTTTNEAGMLVTNTVTEVLESEGSAELRSLLEIGVESSFKAFKIMHEDPIYGGFYGLRHVAEPFINYTYVPEPNVLPEELFQFDRTDRLRDRDDLLFGMRHKFQTKTDLGLIHDLVDVEIFSTYDFEPDEATARRPAQDEFGPLVVDAELRPVANFPIDIDFKYNYEQSFMEEFNTQVGYLASDLSNIYLEYRFRDEEALQRETDRARNQVAVITDLFPNSTWAFETYHRYNFDESMLEEHEYLLKKKLDCIGVGLGYREIFKEDEEDDILVYGVLWLQALPFSSVQLGR